MMAGNLFQFGPYCVREATIEDHDLIAQWIARDPEHVAKQIQPEFFYRNEPGVGCYLLLDAQGPIYFWRTSNVVRLDSQFGPSDTPEQRERNREALVSGMDWLAGQCGTRGATEILFESVAPLLRRLAIQRMGCEAMPGELVRSLEPERRHVTFGGERGTAPQPAPAEEKPHVRS
jgi:hypothetical protein